MIGNVVTISLEVQSGSPVFVNTRVPIKNLFDYLLGGDTIEEFLEDFPSVTKEQVIKLLTIAEHTLTYTTNDYEENYSLGRKLAKTA